MPKRRHLSPLPIFDEQALIAFLRANDFKPVHAMTIWHALAHGKIHSLAEIKNLDNVPKKLVPMLEAKFALTTSTVQKVQHAKDQQTTKLLIQLQDGSNIETVLMHFGNNNADDDSSTTSASSPPREDGNGKNRANEGPGARETKLRTGGEEKKNKKKKKKKHNTNRRSTLCVSSQVGCRMGCKFCATGTMGLRGHLLSGEIIEQLYHARQHSLNPVRNVVFMGMGEPLDNFDSVLAAVTAMSDPRRFGLAPSRITVSTVGVIPYMRRLRRSAPQVQLAISLHAPTQELREKIVPTARAYPLEKLMHALDEHLEDPRVNLNSSRKVMMEYVVIRGVNDSDECARQLLDLLKPRIGKSGKNVILNLIPYNPTDVPENYEAPTEERVRSFHSIIREGGVLVTVRYEKGQDISGACGQLVVQAEKERKRGGGREGKGGRAVSDIEDLLPGATARDQSDAEALRRRNNRSTTRRKKTKKKEITRQVHGVTAHEQGRNDRGGGEDDGTAAAASHDRARQVKFFWLYIAVWVSVAAGYALTSWRADS